MTDFTPGPWKYCGCGKCGIVYAPSREADIAHALCEDDHILHGEGIPSVTVDEKVANARLIAESPAMFGLLTRAVEGRGVIKEARALLARVSGDGLA